MKRALFFAVPIVLLTASGPARAHAEQGCEALAATGLLDVRNTPTFEDKVVRFFTRLKYDENLTLVDAKGYAAATAMPLEKIMLANGVAFDQKGYEKFVLLGETAVRESLKSMTSDAEATSTMVADIMKLVTACQKLNGVKAWVDYPSKGKRTFVLMLRFDAPRSEDPVMILVKSTPNISCRGEVERRKTARFPLDQTRDMAVYCERLAPLDEVALVSIELERSPYTSVVIGTEVWFPPAVIKN